MKKKLNEIKSAFKWSPDKAKLSIQQIAISGIFLALIGVSKWMDLVMPKTPLGVAVWEVYVTVIVATMIVLPLTTSMLVLIIAPFLFMAMGQTFLLTPFSFFLDYSLPILVFILIKFGKNKYTAIIFLILAFLAKYACHTLSGVIFYQTTWSASFALNVPHVFITLGITASLLFLGYDKLKKLNHLTSSTQEIRW